MSTLGGDAGSEHGGYNTPQKRAGHGIQKMEGPLSLGGRSCLWPCTFPPPREPAVHVSLLLAASGGQKSMLSRGGRHWPDSAAAICS